MEDLKPEEVVAKPRRTLLPVLTVLFLVSYGLMAMLVVEQGRTIDSQRDLIRSLFDDSMQLSILRGKLVQKKQNDAPHPPQGQPKAKSPETKAPPDPRTETPAMQSAPEGKNRRGGKLRRAIPERPPKGAFDQGDERRARISI